LWINDGCLGTRTWIAALPAADKDLLLLIAFVLATAPTLTWTESAVGALPQAAEDAQVITTNESSLNVPDTFSPFSPVATDVPLLGEAALLICAAIHR
jgi:hypothetical protein